jgi:hypothetical protein
VAERFIAKSSAGFVEAQLAPQNEFSIRADHLDEKAERLKD